MVRFGSVRFRSHIVIACIGVGACNDEHPDVMQTSDTDGDGVLTGFVEEGEGGADETAGPELVGCLGVPVDGVAGVKYQCAAEYDLGIVAHVDPAIGSSYDIVLPNTVNTLNDSTYDHPIAMACCAPLEDLGDDTCELVQGAYQRACMQDLIAHACTSAGKLLVAESHDIIVGNGSEAV
jgi:hypothetical protein